MASSFENITIKFILAAMLLISVFSFIIITQSDNEAVDPIGNNPVFNETMGNLVNKIDNGTSSAQEKYDAFSSEEPQTGFGSIVLFGIVSVGKAFSQIIFGFFGAIIKLPLIILGIPASIYNLIFMWLVIIVIIAAWLLYKLGG